MAKASAQPALIDAPIVVLVGPERFLALDHTDTLRAALTKKHGEVQTAVFDAAASPADVLDELRSMSLMMTHKFVVVDNADLMLKGGEDDEAAPPVGKRAPSRGPRELFTDYAQRPEPSATLVLRAAKWNKGNLDKAIESAGGVFVACEEPRSADAAAWCVSRAKSHHGATIDAPAAKLLVENIGPDLGRLDSELEKLAVAASASDGKAAVTAAHVASMVGFSREEDIWSMQRFLLQPDAGVALREVRHRLDVSRENPVGLLVGYLDLARKLDGASRGLAAKENPAAIAARLRLWGASVNTILDAGRKLPPGTSAALLGAAVEADAKCKSGRGDPERIVETLTLKFVGAAR